MSKNQILSRLLPVGFSALLVIVDQMIKLWALDVLWPAGRVEVVPGLFYLTYVENRGAAFGILQGKTLLLALLTGAVLAALLVYMLMGKAQGRLLTWSLSLVLAGGVGNLIDRVARGFVVDYLDFSALFDFPVFNFADCCVVVGAILIICCIAWTDFSSSRRGKAGESEA